MIKIHELWRLYLQVTYSGRPFYKNLDSSLKTKSMRFISSLALVQLAAYANFAELLDTTRNNDIDEMVR